jgi:membrane-associated HD superfamily phosphohydrolase
MEGRDTQFHDMKKNYKKSILKVSAILMTFSILIFFIIIVILYNYNSNLSINFALADAIFLILVSSVCTFLLISNRIHSFNVLKIALVIGFLLNLVYTGYLVYNTEIAIFEQLWEDTVEGIFGIILFFESIPLGLGIFCLIIRFQINHYQKFFKDSMLLYP